MNATKNATEPISKKAAPAKPQPKAQPTTTKKQSKAKPSGSAKNATKLARADDDDADVSEELFKKKQAAEEEKKAKKAAAPAALAKKLEEAQKRNAELREKLEDAEADKEKEYEKGLKEEQEKREKWAEDAEEDEEEEDEEDEAEEKKRIDFMDKKADIAEKHLDEMEEEEAKEEEKGSRAEARHKKHARAMERQAASEDKLNMKLAKELDKVTKQNEKESLEKEYRAFLDHKEKREHRKGRKHGHHHGKHRRHRHHKRREQPKSGGISQLDANALGNALKPLFQNFSMAGRPDVVSRPAVVMNDKPTIVAQPVGAAPAAVNVSRSSSNPKAPQSFEITAPQGQPIQIDAVAPPKPKAPAPKPLVLSGAEHAKGKDMMVYDVTISLVDKQTEEHGSRG